MHLQVLSSGSQGNATLVRAGEVCALVDAGLPAKEMTARLESARVAPQNLSHILVTHGHLDHARSAGILSRRHRATLHCAEAVMRNASIRRSKRLSALRIGSATEIEGSGGLRYTAVLLPHDAVPTVAYRLEHEGRSAVILTDMGKPSSEVARKLGGAHVLVLEFNHDPTLLRNGPYPESLQRRIRGNAGHLSNEQAADMLRWMVSDDLHTLVLAHLSESNNTAELALAAARSALAGLGLGHVRVLVASQHEIGPNLPV